MTDDPQQFSVRSELHAYMRTLQPRIGMAPLEGDVLDSLVVRGTLADESIDVHIVALPNENIISLSAVVGTVRDDRREEMLQAVAAAGLFGAITLGLHLSLSPKTDEIHIGYSLIFPGASYDQFETAFARTIAHGIEWRRRLRSIV